MSIYEKGIIVKCSSVRPAVGIIIQNIDVVTVRSLGSYSSYRLYPSDPEFFDQLTGFLANT